MSTFIKPGDTVLVKAIAERGQGELNSLQGKQGKVLARRVVDGSGVGYIVQLSDQTTHWFFAQELERR